MPAPAFDFPFLSSFFHLMLAEGRLGSLKPVDALGAAKAIALSADLVTSAQASDLLALVYSALLAVIAPEAAPDAASVRVRCCCAASSLRCVAVVVGEVRIVHSLFFIAQPLSSIGIGVVRRQTPLKRFFRSCCCCCCLFVCLFYCFTAHAKSA